MAQRTAELRTFNLSRFHRSKIDSDKLPRDEVEGLDWLTCLQCLKQLAKLFEKLFGETNLINSFCPRILLELFVSLGIHFERI